MRKEPGYSVAVDLGTTHIRISLLDMTDGEKIGEWSIINPQEIFGADVLTRLTAAESSQLAGEMSSMARRAIGRGIKEIAERKTIGLREIKRLMIVGNTAMLTLLTGKNYDKLLVPRYWVQIIECLPGDAGEWRRSWGIDSKAAIEIVQPLGGFVGSDLLTGVLATGLVEGPDCSLLIDFGANSEIALWDGLTLWVTSAAGGPAFEGSGISCGMPAGKGAIYKVELDAGGEFLAEVIGGGEAKGICGSGLVDIIASMVRGGMLNGGGRFEQDVGEAGLPIMEGRTDIALKKQDVDVFQRAKAAIAAGTICLMKKAGVGVGDLKRVCVCGSFGRLLNIVNAQVVGLLPEVDGRKIELLGNTALAGCEQLLLSNDLKALENVRERSRLINMSMAPEFEELFIENLYLKPMRM